MSDPAERSRSRRVLHSAGRVLLAAGLAAISYHGFLTVAPQGVALGVSSAVVGATLIYWAIPGPGDDEDDLTTWDGSDDGGDR